MWWGAEHNDQRMDSKSKLKIEISEKKKKRICVFLMESVRLLLLSLGVFLWNFPGMFFWR